MEFSKDLSQKKEPTAVSFSFSELLQNPLRLKSTRIRITCPIVDSKIACLRSKYKDHGVIKMKLESNCLPGNESRVNP